MTSRILPPAEWPRLVGTEAETAWPSWPPEYVSVVVVEHGGQIVGCHAVMSVVHVECLWVHPDHRKRASVARRLWAAVQRVAVERFGVSGVVTSACSNDVRTLLAHVGAKRIPGEAYTVPVRIPCQP